MSETSEGTNWWRAANGQWYPPEAHPRAWPETQSRSLPRPFLPESAPIQRRDPRIYGLVGVVILVVVLAFVTAMIILMSGGG